MQKAYNDRYEETEQDRQDEERYERKRNMSMEEKKEVFSRIPKEALENARKMVAASGQKPSEYNPVTRECMAAMIYGMLSAMSIEELGYCDLVVINGMMAAIANVVLEIEAESSFGLTERLHKSASKKDPECNINMNQLIHIGIDAYYCLDRPEFLANGIQKVLDACYANFGIGEEN